jgi:hypothetical protein|tara:strand:+ start:248 stop:418 length:171 start_codon:yes stop_codon:yes gene_type:complete
MFQIIGKYNVSKYEGHGYYCSFEVIDTASSKSEAYALLHEYELSFGSDYELDILEE